MPASQPITLAIEISNPAHASPLATGVVMESGGGSGTRRSAAVGLARGETWLGGIPLDSSDRHDDALMPGIDRLCREHGVTPRDLSRIAVSVGPGGFTSLRIAVTVAKVIAETSGAACIPVPTAEASILAVDPARYANRAVSVCLAWKRETVWRQL
ncbi:MAG TPA: tRNA (adenosine(37)-N6)-threonylcarbamoyltransferase complex dimerization subunit type 1 TsaB, partial [Phycisphaerales bacterium]|nr:tRNA (adenosine(37)-N6)-threonylcarbamoyltransferase complex dimerization subunit type 1 TsaB [Phycisphaerales bacterium]